MNSVLSLLSPAGSAGFGRAMAETQGTYTMRTIFNMIEGNTERVIASLEGEAAEAAWANLAAIYTVEQIEQKIASCAWDYVEGRDAKGAFMALSVFF